VTREEHRRVNFDLCTALDLTKLGLALDRMIAHGTPTDAATQYRTLALSFLTLLRGENDRLLALAAPPSGTARGEDEQIRAAAYAIINVCWCTPFMRDVWREREAAERTIRALLDSLRAPAPRPLAETPGDMPTCDATSAGGAPCDLDPGEE
jgi:hypothetical protein